MLGFADSTQPTARGDRTSQPYGVGPGHANLHLVDFAAEQKSTARILLGKFLNTLESYIAKEPS